MKKVRGAGIGAWPSLIGDLIAFLAAVAVIGLSVADVLKLYELHWYKDHQIPILLCLVSFLIIAVIFERRISLSRLFAQTLTEVAKVQPDSLGTRLKNAGLSNFYTSRADYERYRGVGDLQGYLRRATKTFHITAYWLSQGTEMEGIARELADIIRSNDRMRVSIAIVSPASPSRSALASYLDMKTDDLTSRINSSLEQLAKVYHGLNQAQKSRFQIKTYQTLPIASTIMLDVAERSGRIQIDIKIYKVARQFSIGFEVQRSESKLYERPQNATLQLIHDSEDLDVVRFLHSPST